jgi:hypothetical protein
MKTISSMLVLGASMAMANADKTSAPHLTGSAQFSDGTQTYDLQRDAEGLDASGGAEVDCVTAVEFGTAGQYYGSAELTGSGDAKPSILGDYRKGTTLAFWCGLKKDGATLEIVTAGSTTQPVASGTSTRVLVRFDGTNDCLAQAGTLTTSMESDPASSNSKLKFYRPQVKSTVSYGCIHAHDFEPPKVSALLGLKGKGDAHSKGVITQTAGSVAQETAQESLVRTGDTTFEKSWVAEFDLGAAEPHSYYYDNLDGCTSDLCFGKLTVKSDENTKYDIATALSADVWVSDDQVTYYDLKGSSGRNKCADVTYTSTAPTTQAAVCAMTKSSAKGEHKGTGESEARNQGLLMPLECPFADTVTASKESDVDACLAAGDTAVVNTCADRDTYGTPGAATYNQEDTIPLKNGFSIKLQFPDAQKTRYMVETLKITEPVPQVFHEGTQVLTWNLVTTGDSAEATNLFVERGDFNKPVTLTGNSISQFTAPLSVASVDLKGYVFTSCSSELITLATVTLPTSKFDSAKSGNFTVFGSDECDGRFTFNPVDSAVNLTFANVYAGGNSLGKVSFCKEGDTPSDCKNDANRSKQTTPDTRQAIIENVCEGVENGHVGGLVRFEKEGTTSYDFAPIICAGPCTKSDLDDFTLDWSVTLTAGVNSGDNAFSATQAGVTFADAKGNREGLIKQNFLVAQSSNVGCAADGTLIGSVPSGKCSLSGDNNIAQATDIQNLFNDCNENDADGTVKLVQTLKVEYKGTSDDLYFCNSKDLSISIDSMTGQTTSSIGILVSEEQDAAKSISVSFDTIQYEACDGTDAGKHKLVATINVDDSELPADSYDFEQTSSDILFDGALALASDLITFQTACRQVCGIYGSTISSENVLAGTVTETTDGEKELAQISFSVSTQVLGDPCGEGAAVERGDVTLDIYAVDDEVDCFAAAEDAARAQDDKLCANLTLSDFGNSGFKVTQELLQRVPSDQINADLSFKQGAVIKVVDHKFFAHNRSLGSGDATHTSSQTLDLAADDAFTTYKLTVYWEQILASAGGRRLLRSEHVFGAGEHKSVRSLVILPASAQIEDAAESLNTASGDVSANDGSSVEESSDAKKDEGLPGGAIVGIIVGSAAALIGIGYAYVKVRDGRRESLGGSPRYSAVRRSERFSTMNF